MSSLDLILVRITKLEQCITDLTEQMQKMNASIKKVNIPPPSVMPIHVTRSTMTPPITTDSPSQTI